MLKHSEGAANLWKTLQVSAAFVVAAAVLGAGPALAEGAKIGAAIPMTGALQTFGPTTLSGIQMAVDEVNAAGGVLGGELELVVGDTQTNPQAGVDAAKRLVTVDGVAGIVGALSSGVTIPIASSVTSVDGVPQISTASTSPVITTLDDNDFLFRTTPHDAVQGELLARLVQAEGVGAVSIVYVNNDYGQGLAEAFRDNYGGEIMEMVAYEEKQASYRGELSRAAEGGPDSLILIGYPEDGIPILRQSLEEGYFESFIFTDGMKANDVVQAIGQQFLEGSFGTAPESVADAPAAARWRELYAQNVGELPTDRPFIDTAYDAAMVLALAIEAAGSTDGAAVRDAIRKVSNPPGAEVLPGEFAKAKELIAAGEDIDYVGAAGSQDFDENGDVPGTFGHWVFDGGEVRTVKLLDK
jgi:branched-chain amino acid transport system substrate-binding protein